MVSPTIQEYLRQANVIYTVFPHPPAFSAQEEAAVAHVPGRLWAKVVVCFADGAPIQAVVPADRQVDLEDLAYIAGVSEIRLADESELLWLYPDCELGAQAPLGPLYRQPVFVDETLTADRDIVFNAGTHRDAVCMRYRDFARLTQPTVGRFAHVAV